MRAWVWVALIFAPVSWALEFGLPEVGSEKNAPLEVRVPVTNLGSVDPSQLFPMLAPESAFFEKGVDRPEMLSRLLYSIERRGSAVELVIRTLAPWTDPEFTTLVEVFTPQGAMLLPVSLSVFEDSSPVVVTAEAAAPAEPVADASPQAPPAIQTLRVSDGATLWRLAARIKPESVTMEQVILSLYETNPAAFEYGNVNALEKGKILQVPSLERMLLTSAMDAKRVFDAHMREPKRDFRVAQIESANAASVLESPASAVPVAAPVVAKTGPETDMVAVSRHEGAAPRATDVDALLEKIAVLENKLDQVDAKLEVIANQRPTASETQVQSVQQSELPAPSVPPAPPQPSAPSVPANVQSGSSSFDFDWASLWARVQSELPSEQQWRAFWRTELGQGTAIFLVVLALVMLMRRVYGGDSVAAIPPRESHVTPPVIADDIPPFGPALQAEVASSASRLDGGMQSPLQHDAEQAMDDDVLESAIARLKSKIEDPTRMNEAEALYQQGDDSLIEAFSADALNENPEWGQDPDDEADVAKHQLELARNYLDMGMRQTAIELLERVCVSPHQASAQKARALLDAQAG
jgi:FimV-like protein